MADITMKRGDTNPPLAFTLTGADGAPQNLTGATVRFKVRDRRREIVTDRECTVLDADAGSGQYEWIPADTANHGHYETEFEVTLASGKVGTFPNGGFLSLEIVEDIR